jgi:hypothetical protein
VALIPFAVQKVFTTKNRALHGSYTVIPSPILDALNKENAGALPPLFQDHSVKRIQMLFFHYLGSFSEENTDAFLPLFRIIQRREYRCFSSIV